MKPTTHAQTDVMGAAARLLATALIAHFASGLLPALGGAALATECRDLTGVTLAHATVRSAEPIDSGMFSVDSTGHAPVANYSGLPAFCRVRGLSTPVAGSEIGFEVWLPQAKDWTRRLHMVGNGAYSSNIYYAQMAARIRAGDVAVGTDTGPQGRPGAKDLPKAYYGASPTFSYFSGCSTGGYQGLMAAQRHPEDFDGIIAGDPGNNRSNPNLAFLWQFLSNHPHGDDDHQIVPNAKLLLINHAIVDRCDRLDGVADGVINDPRICHFDVRSLQCARGDAPNCLTRAQIDT